MSKVLFENFDGFGPYGYRAVAETGGKRVKLQRRQNGSRWRTIRIIQRQEFDTWSESVDLFNPYKQDPAKLAYLTDAED